MGILDTHPSITRADPVLDDAAIALHRAEAAAQVRVVELSAVPEIAEAAALWDRIWQAGSAPRLGPEMLRALTHAGNYLGGATRDGQLVGALAGFFAAGGELHVHSHILGVDAAARSAGVGFALKLHQRLWALERGISRITWTFDPLVSANAYFNVGKLGAEGVEYHTNFYGALNDAINGDDDTDRVLISWRLRDDAVARACRGGPSADDDAVLDGMPHALRVLPDGDPGVDQWVAEDTDAGPVLCQLPRDIVALRREHPDRAAAWRRAVRQVTSAAFGRGLVLRSVTRDGVYVLGRTGHS
jgi:predicted GNAT superfamily acetyltransferase